MSEGRFITFEGGEGVGKTTQMQLLRSHLESKGRKVVQTREPGGTPGAEAVRHVLLSGLAERFGVDMEALLFAAARRDNVEQIILPSVAAGRIVISDRFLDSSRVYQGAVGGVSHGLLDALEAAAVEGAIPDLTILLDMPADEAVHRMRARQSQDRDDRYERERMDVHRKRRDAFLAIAEREPERVRIVDAARNADEVQRDVVSAVEESIG